MRDGLGRFVGVGVVEQGAQLIPGSRGFGENFGAAFGDEHKLREIAEGGGPTGGDAFGGIRVKDHVEGVLDALLRKSFPLDIGQLEG